MEFADGKWTAAAGSTQVAAASSAVFLSLAAGIALVKAVPQLHRFLHHGKVAQAHGARPRWGSWLEAAAQATVPKAWFRHFYVVFAALMWPQVVLVPAHGHSKYVWMWALLTAQATRRTWESYAVTRWSTSSRMHVSHYLVGLTYYVLMSVLCATGLSGDGHSISWARAVAPVGVFALVSVDQYQNHVHLARLVKYSVPTLRFFAWVSCAHYLDEIVLYLVVVAVLFWNGPVAPVDWAFACSWVFAVVNLTISALETRAYYRRNFEYNVRHAIVPYVI